MPPAFAGLRARSSLKFGPAEIRAQLDAIAVAQVCNLPYRRFAIGSAPISR